LFHKIGSRILGSGDDGKTDRKILLSFTCKVCSAKNTKFISHLVSAKTAVQFTRQGIGMVLGINSIPSAQLLVLFGSWHKSKMSHICHVSSPLFICRMIGNNKKEGTNKSTTRENS
jgi:hypothetical protein